MIELQSRERQSNVMETNAKQVSTTTDHLSFGVIVEARSKTVSNEQMNECFVYTFSCKLQVLFSRKSEQEIVL